MRKSRKYLEWENLYLRETMRKQNGAFMELSRKLDQKMKGENEMNDVTNEVRKPGLSVATGELNYEAECERLKEENAKLTSAVDIYKACNRDLEEENRKLQAQLDIVYLIFGNE